MFCPMCGNAVAPPAQFCATCGGRVAQPSPVMGAAGQDGGYVASSSSGAATAPAPYAAPEPSYLFGYIQGWGMAVGGPLLFLLFLLVMLSGDSDKDTRLGAIVLMAGSALAAVTGYGLLRKLKFGMVLIFVWTGLHAVLVLLALIAMLAPDRAAALGLLLYALVSLGIWTACAAYYYKRRQLFR